MTQSFCWVLILDEKLVNDEVVRKRFAFYLVLAFMFLFAWDLAWAGSDHRLVIGAYSTLLWTLPSLILATFCDIAILVAFAVRYRSYSWAVLPLQLCYAIFQVPAYSEAFDFVRSSDPRYSLLLALLKILSGVTAYSMFCLLPADFSSPVLGGKFGAVVAWFSGLKVWTRVIQTLPRGVVKVLKIIWGLLGLLLLHTAAVVAYHFLQLRISWLPH